ncbi:MULTISPECIES: complex I NDUFA9 subunit family protein [Sphingopyxis]|uniref:complex I NDUFA9 subunit family protein n=1 Tax=Sphingopyxis TaxID=165697 RepID=UPI00086D362F|nr:MULTISPECIES: complex I NDUFA9 subunit family protein [Sphingopyxis]APW74183.1 complex I NDUFA9 subunit family protein [Sphingopyxis granuli]AVA15798.1 complex I NDUFA9 subunit family protein [Sphingopyxis sp. MG]ODU25862.1 MAG: 3-beta hydroxysteroid dehydrogenase [Sphingopyxis sp. SCN 67-31]QUM71835.1 complex I NDUFA9 subunit family protein [Sphingopyxis granuli]
MRNLDGQLITVLGGGGFVGRYVVQRLLTLGARVRVAQRDPRAAVFLKPLGGLGQTQFVAADVRDAASVARAVQGSDAVVNLAGSFDAMHAVQAEGAGHAAAAAKAAGARAFAHVSAIGADRDSASAYGRSKGDGEAAVRAAFPEATILRPSIVFGREDRFINRFAALMRMTPVVPVIAPATKLQPVYVGDVADAVVAALAAPAAGDLFELGGPQVLTMAALQQWIAAATGRKRLFVEMPDAVAAALAAGLGWLPGAPITRDQWRMLQVDNVVAPGAAGLAQLGITPTSLAAVAEGWLVQYRRHGRFAGAAAR